MRYMVAGLISLSIVLIGGCTTRESRTATDRVDAAIVASARAQLTRADPSAIVGVVMQSLPRERFAAVGDVPVDEFRVGEVVTFIDVEQRQLTHGVVRRITSDTLHVEFEPPPRGGRAPRVGDLAVRFKSTVPRRAALE